LYGGLFRRLHGLNPCQRVTPFGNWQLPREQYAQENYRGNQKHLEEQCAAKRRGTTLAGSCGGIQCIKHGDKLSKPWALISHGSHFCVANLLLMGREYPPFLDASSRREVYIGYLRLGL
jgi:hypothetical protein